MVERAIVVWDIDLTTWPELACQAVGRNLTLEEWQELGPKGPYHATSTQWSRG